MRKRQNYVNELYYDIHIVEALKSLGYKQADIKKVVKNVNSDLSIEEQIKEALKLLLK